MSLITRCPACVTLFKVVPDQLRISEGWVRCGQCDEVFDASLHLQSELPAVPAPAVDLDLTADLPTQAEVLLTEPKTASEDMADAKPLDHLPLAQEGRPAAMTDESVPDSWGELAKDVASPQWPDALDAAPDLGLNSVSFLRAAQTAPVSRKPWQRMAWLGLTVTLLLGLAGQWLVHERDRLLAAEPGLRPALEALCAPLNCVLSPLRQIESIVIDSASFTKIRGNAYRLNFMVKNTAAMALALPAIEVTLTNSSEQTVVRRVFLPTELGATLAALAPGAEWPASAVVALKLAGSADQVAGYRVLAFYP